MMRENNYISDADYERRDCGADGAGEARDANRLKLRTSWIW